MKRGNSVAALIMWLWRPVRTWKAAAIAVCRNLDAVPIITRKRLDPMTKAAAANRSTTMSKDPGKKRDQARSRPATATNVRRNCALTRTTKERPFMRLASIWPNIRLGKQIGVECAYLGWPYCSNWTVGKILFNFMSNLKYLLSRMSNFFYLPQSFVLNFLWIAAAFQTIKCLCGYK